MEGHYFYAISQMRSSILFMGRHMFSVSSAGAGLPVLLLSCVRNACIGKRVYDPSYTLTNTFVFSQQHVGYRYIDTTSVFHWGKGTLRCQLPRIRLGSVIPGESCKHMNIVLDDVRKRCLSRSNVGSILSRKTLPPPLPRFASAMPKRVGPSQRAKQPARQPHAFGRAQRHHWMWTGNHHWMWRSWRRRVHGAGIAGEAPARAPPPSAG